MGSRGARVDPLEPTVYTPLGCKPTIGEFALDERALLGHLEALAHTLGIPIRYEHMEGETPFSSGGLCRIKDNHVIIVNEDATPGEKTRILAKALRRFDLSQVYLKPALREYLEKIS